MMEWLKKMTIAELKERRAEEVKAIYYFRDAGMLWAEEAASNLMQDIDDEIMRRALQ